MDTNLAARFRAVESLQRSRNRYAYGSARFDEIDHAIDLALGMKRSVGPYLLRNVLRDAQRIVRRRRRRQRVTLESDYLAAVENPAPLNELLVDPTTPEDEVIASELCERIVSGQRDEPGQDRSIRVLEGLVEGRTTREIAQLEGICPAYATKLSQRLRKATAATLPLR